MIKAFDPSKYPKNVQELCKRDEEPPYVSDLLVDELDYKTVYSLTETDVPHLLDIAVHASADEDVLPEKYTFAPSNAWGALEQFASPELLPKVLDAINKIDWVHTEFCYASILRVLVRCGLDDPSLLLAAVHDETRYDATRDAIIESLVRLQTIRPEYREDIIKALTTELSKLEIGYREFYGDIAGALDDLRSHESLPLIEKAYKQGLIDPDFSDWLESIQKNLGGETVSDPAIDRFEADMQEVGKIIFELGNCDQTFPKETILKARKYRDVLIPSLIETVRQATAYARYDVPLREGTNIFVVHLLAEFQAKEALPAIFESLSITDDQAYELYSESYYEGLPGILYRIIGNDLDVFDRKIRDSKTPYPLRRSLLEALPYFVKNKELDRDSYANLIRDYFRLAIDEQDKCLARDVLDLLLDVGDPSDIPLVEEIDKKGLLDEEFTGMEDAVAELSQGGRDFDERIQRRTDSDYSDTIAEMQDWAWFQPEEKYTPLKSLSLRPVYPPLPLGDDSFEKSKKIGRNDPCPCGSGKKFKKCCGK